MIIFLGPNRSVNTWHRYLPGSFVVLLILQWQGVLTVVVFIIFFNTVMNQAGKVALHFIEQC